MSKHYLVAQALSALAIIAVGGCSGLAPNHHAKYVFQGKVADKNGNPIPNAIVKIRGWETLTNEQGRWRQEQYVHCGTLRTEITGTDSPDQILVLAEGFEPSEENFVVKHPTYFQSCDPEQTIAIETAMVSRAALKAETKAKQTRALEKSNEEQKWSAPKKKSAEEVSL